MTFYELLRKCIYNFSERISSSSNSIIKACLSPIIFIFSPLRRWWRAVLFQLQSILFNSNEMHYLYRYVCIFLYICIWTIVCNKEFIYYIIIHKNVPREAIQLYHINLNNLTHCNISKFIK